MQVLQNGLSNTILPYDVRVNKGSQSVGFGVPSGNLAAGSVQILIFEVLVSKLIRMALRMENRTFGKLILIHAISLPLTGGLVGFSDPQVALKTDPSLQEALTDGAKGVPAIFVAQYITNTALQGLHMPKISFRDILITAAARILTRPILKYGYAYMPAAIADNFDANDEMVQNQNKASRLNR